MAIPATNLRRGQVIQHEGELWIVVEVRHVKLSKGPGAMQAKIKNLKRGEHITYRFRSSDKIEVAFLDKRACEYLYQDGNAYVFMDLENYEQYHLAADLVGDLMGYIKPNTQVQVTFHESAPVTVELPSAVVLEVAETEPGMRGDTATNVFKPATLETGIAIKVPLHINKGDRVKVNTETGEFIERVNE